MTPLVRHYDYHGVMVTVTLENPDAIPALQRSPALLASVRRLLEVQRDAVLVTQPETLIEALPSPTHCCDSGHRRQGHLTGDSRTNADLEVA